MKIKTYLKKTNQTKEEFSQRAGISRVTLWRIITGKFRPALPTAQAIVRATKGKVGFTDL